MTRGAARGIGLAGALVLIAAGCHREGGAAPDRCARCGMRVDLAPEFRAGAIDRAGAEVAFDAPKCLFRWLGSPAGDGAREPWVTEYYGQTRAPLDAVRYVIGSDVVGPMGHDLVPVAGDDAADRFLGDHDGERVVGPRDIDDALLDALDAPGGPG